MGELGLGASAGFLVAGAGACSVVGGAESYPSVGRTMSKSVFIGGRWLRRLWAACLLMGGTVFSLLVVWRAACQHWNLWPVEWGQLSAKTVTSGRAHTAGCSLGPLPPVSFRPR